MMLAQLPSLILLVLGFGFVIFFHELGHFFAAKWVGIKVEQFAVGFGQAMVSWRKGLGFRVGSSTKETAAGTRASSLRMPASVLGKLLVQRGFRVMGSTSVAPAS